MASELQNSNVPNGAFSFALDRALRESVSSESSHTWEEVVNRATGELRKLGFKQTPQCLAATAQNKVSFMNLLKK